MLGDVSPLEREKRFQQFLRVRLFGLVAGIDNPRNERETFPMASGIVIEARGLLVFVTAAHYVLDVTEWRSSGRLNELALIIHHESGLCAAVPLDLSKTEIYFNRYIDVGFFMLDHDVIERIIKHGGKVVHQSNAIGKDVVPDRCFLVGHASAHSKVSRDKIASSVQGSIESKWELLRLSDLAVVFVSVELMGSGDSPCTFKFKPKQTIDNYSGTSGGPIFGYNNGATFNDYRLFGIQSKQILAATSDQKPKYLIATSAKIGYPSNDIIDKLTRESRSN
jgi:hypothetical protein